MSNLGEFQAVMGLVIEGKLSSIIDKIYSLKRVKDTKTYLSEGKQFGKVLIRIS